VHAQLVVVTLIEMEVGKKRIMRSSLLVTLVVLWVLVCSEADALPFGKGNGSRRDIATLVVDVLDSDLGGHVKVNLKNLDINPVAFLTRNTPWDSMVPAIAFQVVDVESEEKVSYIGPLLNLADPTMDDVLVLQAGDSMSVDVDIAESFKLLKGRKYHVSLRSKPWTLLSFTGPEIPTDLIDFVRALPSGISEKAVEITATQDSVEPWTLESKNANAKSIGTRQGSYQIVGCSVFMESKMETSVNRAVGALDALLEDYIQSIDECSEISDYVEWFGTRSSRRVNIVDESMENALNKFTSGGYIINCGGLRCSSSTFAYVFPTDPDYNIFMCDVGQNAPGNIEYNSQPGTLIHEMLHFVEIGDTDDLAYGATDCRALAIQNPDDAVENSDSYEYFVEFQSSCVKDGSTPNPDSGSVCFPVSATVELEGGAIIKMKELEVGDRVRVGANEFSEVVVWSHKDPDVLYSNFVELDIENGRRSLRLTASHMVYSSGELKPAGLVQVGEYMEDADFGTSQVTGVRKNLTLKGLMNPHTLHGNIVVDGIVVSTYTSAISANVAHALLAVERFGRHTFKISFLGSLLHSGSDPYFLSLLLKLFS